VKSLLVTILGFPASATIVCSNLLTGLAVRLAAESASGLERGGAHGAPYFSGSETTGFDEAGSGRFAAASVGAYCLIDFLLFINPLRYGGCHFVLFKTTGIIVASRGATHTLTFVNTFLANFCPTEDYAVLCLLLHQ